MGTRAPRSLHLGLGHMRGWHCQLAEPRYHWGHLDVFVGKFRSSLAPLRPEAWGPAGLESKRGSEMVSDFARSA